MGPGAYFFIAFSHFTARNYDPYILPPAQNVTIIKNTVNVTNITYNKNIVNNFGPSVTTIQQKTDAVIKPVSLAYQPGKTPSSSISNGVLKVTGPGTKLNPVATKLPPATIKNPHPVVDKGWKGVDPKTANELKTKIAKENPTPPNLPKPTVTPIRVLRGGALPTASPKPGATVFGASTPPGGVKPLPTGGPKGSATPLKGNVKGGFNPANPGAAGVMKSPSGTPKPTGTPGRPGGAVTPGTLLQGSPTPKPTGRGAGATPTPQVPTPTPKPAEHLATPTPHHSATPPPTSHPTVHLATPPPHHVTPAAPPAHHVTPAAPPAHHATPAPHPHPATTPNVTRKPEGGGGGGAAQHNQPVYHPSGGGGKPPAGGGGKPKPTPTPKK
jgi:hypothetical protein